MANLIKTKDLKKVEKEKKVLFFIAVKKSGNAHIELKSQCCTRDLLFFT